MSFCISRENYMQRDQSLHCWLHCLDARSFMRTTNYLKLNPETLLNINRTRYARLIFD